MGVSGVDAAAVSLTGDGVLNMSSIEGGAIYARPFVLRVSVAVFPEGDDSIIL